MRDHTTFDFPASKVVRDHFHDKRRPALPSIGRHSDEQDMIDYISLLESENSSVTRLVLDVARLGKAPMVMRHEERVASLADAIAVEP